MKVIFLWLINTIIILPFKIIMVCYQVLKNIFFNNFDLKDIDTMDGYEFEHFTKLLLEKNGFKKVTVSQSSNDYGIDVLATKNKLTYAIQCKRYSKTVGIKAVQEAISGCKYYQCDIPVVFTNNTFSPAAINLAKSTNVELWDENRLYQYIKKAKFLRRSLPFYYPLCSFLLTSLISYYYYIKQDKYLLICLLLSLFIFISIMFKILRYKRKAPLNSKELNYNIHNYYDPID